MSVGAFLPAGVSRWVETQRDRPYLRAVMYYDRSLPDDSFRVFSQSRFSARLFGLLRSPWGARVLAHVEFRRSNSQRHKYGSVKLYVGRSAVLEVIAGADTTFMLDADGKYTALAPDLFGQRRTPEAMDEFACAVEEYLENVVSMVGPQFTEGEGRVHAGFVRRYGLDHRTDDLFVAVDKEIKVGFAAKAETDAFTAELRDRFGKAHRELDTIGVLSDGNIGIVELKNEKESVEVAAVQAATHVLTFQRLVADQREREPAFDLGTTLNKLIEQKVGVGLLPELAYRAKPGATLVPVVAAPDGKPGWDARWRSDLRRALGEHGDLLAGLQLWKLSPDGEVVDVVPV